MIDPLNKLKYKKELQGNQRYMFQEKYWDSAKLSKDAISKAKNKLEWNWTKNEKIYKMCFCKYISQ